MAMIEEEKGEYRKEGEKHEVVDSRI